MLDYYKMGQRIRKYRKARNISQEALAEKANISVTHMSHIETGNTKLSLQVLTDIAAYLEVSVDSILFCDCNNNRNTSYNRIFDILEKCSSNELHAIEEIVATTATALKKYT